jgi:hypothetical protein
VRGVTSGPKVTVHRDRRLRAGYSWSAAVLDPIEPDFCTNIILDGCTRRGVCSSVEKPTERQHRDCQFKDANL